MRNGHRLQLVMPRDLHQQLRAAATREANSISSLIRRYVTEGLRQQQHRQP